MLINLYVENLALIERLELDLGSGFNVLSGETGAGKSLVVDAVNLLLGVRASNDLIRSGVDRAVVQGLFVCPDNPEFLARLEEAGIAPEPDGTLTLSRELNRSGRNVCRLGGRVLGLGAYQEIGSYLVDLHGQHEHQSLLDPGSQLLLLDSFGGQTLLAQRRSVADAYRGWREAVDSLAEIEEDQHKEERLKELWEFQSAEISSARLVPGEEESLEAEARLLAGAEQLAAATTAAYQLLFAGAESASSYDLLNRALVQLKPVQTFDAELEEIVRSLQETAYLLEDQSSFLRDYRHRLEFSPDRQAEVQARLHQIRQLRRKYGGSVEEVLHYGEDLTARLNGFLGKSEKLAQLERECADREADYADKAEQLSRMREQAARKLEQEMGAVLSDLNMPHSLFGVELQSASPGLAGSDQVSFAFSANPGEPPRPVARIASGGELSRLMLALKSIMAENDAIPTLIFDEIDAGLGGVAARSVGQKLRVLSRWHQVICVTHAAQIAACAERHFHIAKEEAGGRTVTKVVELDPEGRIRELARMLSGVMDGASLAHARRILQEG